MKKILLTLFILLYFFDANAQKNIFSYDNAGNRTKRHTSTTYKYYDFYSISYFDTSCRCVIVATPTPPDTHALFWFHILSIDGQLAFDFMDPLNASTGSPKGTVTIRHLTDPQKFQKFSINGTTSSNSGFEKFGTVNLLEMGPTPIADGDVVYLTYTVN